MKRNKVKLVLIFILSILLLCMSTTVMAAAKKPAKPKIKSVKSLSSSIIEVKWKKAKNAKKYQVYMAVEGGKFKKVKTVKACSYKYKKAKSGYSYKFKIRAINGKKRSAFSAVKTVRVPIVFSASVKKLNISGGKTKAVILITYKGKYSLNVSAPGNGVVMCDWGNTSNDKYELIVNAKLDGKTELTVFEEGGSAQIVIPVTVSGLGKSATNNVISFIDTKNPLTINVGETKKIRVHTDKGQSITYITPPSYASLQWGDWIPGSNDIWLNITGNSVGTMNLTVYDTDNTSVKASLPVKIVKPANSIVSFQNVDNPLVINVGETKKLRVHTDKHYSVSYTKSPSNITMKWGDWISGTNDVWLYVTGDRVGSGNIIINDINNTSVKDTISVNVLQPVEGVEIYSSSKQLDLAVGDEKNISVSVTPYNASDTNLVWSSSNESVAIVDPKGKVTGRSQGTAIITATSNNGKSDTCIITVHDVIISIPSLPASYNYYGYNQTLYSTTQVEKVEFEKTFFSSSNSFSVKLWVYGEKTYDRSPTVSSSCKIGYKLYDEEGYVVESGTFYSDSVIPGEKYKGYTYLGTNIKDGSYRLELLNAI